MRCSNVLVFPDVEVIAPLDSPLPWQSQLHSSPFSPIITPTQDSHAKRECNSNLNMERQKERSKEFQRLHPSTVNQIMLERDIEVDWGWQQRREEEREANLNKFATLFEPSTPRASPTSLSTPLPSLSDAREDSAIAFKKALFDFPRQPTLPRSSLQTSRPSSLSSSSGSEFGGFVTTSKDPLSFTPIQDRFIQGSMTTTTADELTFLTGSNTQPISSPDATSSASSGTQPPHWTNFPKSDANTTLKFFDEFTYDAKRRSLVARSQVLDELLLHEDDPMWFIFENKGSEILEKLSSTSSSPTSRLGCPSELSDDSKKQETEKRTSTVLLDIDHDYFRPSLSSSRQSNSAPKLSPTMSRSNSMSPPRPAIAPPITSQLTASHYSTTIAQSRESQSDFQEFDPLDQVGNLDPSTRPSKSDSPPKTPSLNSSSYQTVTSLSSKLMSSLLRGGRDTLSERMGTHSSMDSILRPDVEHNDASASPVDQQLSSSFHSSYHLLDERSKSPHPSTGTLTVATSSSLPSARGGRSSSLFTHNHNPFAPATITHGTSPFSPTVYIPPSGAPGFTGDRYDWDKGFSNELESEWQKKRLVNDSNENGTQNIAIDIPNHGNVASSRGGWSPSLGFGFGSVRSKKFNSQTPSHAILGLDGANRASPPRDSHKNRQGRQNGRQSSRSSSTESGGDKMGEFIDQKIGKVELLGRKISSSPVLMPQLASMLRAHIPALSRLSRSWTLLYSLDQHGISLNTLYSRCELHLSQKPAPGEVDVSKGMLLVVKDAVEDGDEAHRALFGAWIAEGLKPNKGKGYSGGGESFLFKYIDGNLKVFKTTGKNSYVSLCEPEYISFGGGDGQYGLYLDDSLFEGSSASCPTFDNEPLCSASIVGNMKTVKYECVGLEVWGMGS